MNPEPKPRNIISGFNLCYAGFKLFDSLKIKQTNPSLKPAMPKIMLRQNLFIGRENLVRGINPV